MFKKMNVLLGLVALLIGTVNAADNFSWVPAEAMDREKAVSGDMSVHANVPIIYTAIPKKTANKSQFRKKYTIDLERFSISNDGTNPVETSAGINAALQYAKKAGKNYIIFPKGIYLISEKTPIVLDLKDTIVDLNGATLQMNKNGLASYVLVKIVHGAENFRLTNGTLRGEKDTHSYNPKEGSHDGGVALAFNGGRELEVDHITVANCTGSGVVSWNAMGKESAPFHREYIYVKDLEKGGVSEKGEKIENEKTTRSSKPYDLTPHGTEFEFGYTAEYQGFPYIRARAYQAYFYDADMKFVEKKNCYQYKKATIPEGAKYIHLEFNQPEVTKSAPKSPYTGKIGYCGFITNLKPPREVHFHHNHIFQNRANGWSFCGGQQWIIENNMFEENGPQSPGYGIDYEDGWLLMQNIIFRYNKFKGNHRGDLVTCAGSELVFEGNEFEKGVHFWPATLSYTFCNNRIKGGNVGFGTRTGMINLHDNVYENCAIKLEYDGRGMNNGVYRGDQPEKGIGGTVEPTKPVTFRDEKFVNVRKITGPYLDFENCKLKNVELLADRKTGLVRFRETVLDGASIDYAAGPNKIYVMIENCEGELKESGSGMNRKSVIE